MILGGSFKFKAIKVCMKQLVFGVVGRLIIVPAIFIPISIALGFRDMELITLQLCFQHQELYPPPFTMAQQIEADSKLVRHCYILEQFLLYSPCSFGYTL